jgi:hypothetical protein
MVQVIFFLYEKETGKNGVRRESMRGTKREKEKKINGVILFSTCLPMHCNMTKGT